MDGPIFRTTSLLAASSRKSKLAKHPAFLVPLCRYATQSASGSKSGSSRKQITIASDDGRVRWADLSRREKAARTTQQSFNFLTVLTGVVMTGGVITLLYLEVFSSDSKTSHFNRAVNQVKKDWRCTDLLGPPRVSKLMASLLGTNGQGQGRLHRNGMEHLQMHFNVEGSLNKGEVHLHMMKRPGRGEFEYKYLALDVKGHPRIYLENADAEQPAKRNKTVFGIRWS